MLRTGDVTGGGVSSQLTFLHPVSEKGFAIAIKWRTLYDSNFCVIALKRVCTLPNYWCMGTASWGIAHDTYYEATKSFCA